MKSFDEVLELAAARAAARVRLARAARHADPCGVEDAIRSIAVFSARIDVLMPGRGHLL